MGYQVQDRVEISVFFDQKEFIFSSINLLNYLHISESRRFYLPALTISLMDRSQFFSRTNALKDGALITIVLKTVGSNSSKKMNFRIWSYESEGAFNYKITGYLDHPIYWNTTSFKPIYGSSSSVLQEICSRCGLTYDGVATNDVQSWYPRNLTYAAFVRRVVTNAWVTDTSFMDVCVSSRSVMLYRNLNDLSKEPIKLSAYSYVEGSYPVTGYELATSSGFNNVLTGYHNAYLNQSIIVNNSLYNELEFKSDSKNPLLNTDLRSQVTRGQWVYTPIDVGNTHESYQKAEYQNNRYANLLSFGLELLIPIDTTIEVFDRVSFAVQVEDASVATQYAGIYTVAEKVTYVQGANYSEKLVVYRHGTNS